MTESPSIVHTKHDCTKSEVRESRENDLPFELAFPSGKKNVTGFRPDSRKVLRDNVSGTEYFQQFV